MILYQQTILGHPPSKANSYRTGRGRFYKSEEVEEYEDAFSWQVKPPKKTIECKFEIELKVYFRSLRSDLDNSFKAILDNLQKNEVIRNDNKCYKITAYKFKDKNNPRVDIKIKRYE